MNVSRLLLMFNPGKNTLVNRSDCQVELHNQAIGWRCIYIWQMTQSEMKAAGVDGQSVCKILLLDEKADPLPPTELRNLAIHHGWKHMRPDEQPADKPFDKLFPLAPGEISLSAGAEYWIEITSGLATDRVTGITLANHDDSDVYGHHVTLLVFQRQSGQIVQPEPEKPTAPPLRPGELAEALRLWKANVDQAKFSMAAAEREYDKVVQLLVRGDS